MKSQGTKWIKIARLAAIAAMVTIVALMVWYFLTHIPRKSVSQSRRESLDSQKIDIKEKLHFLEMKGDAWNFEVKADKSFLGKDDNYHLEGNVEIVQYARDKRPEVSIRADKVISDKDWNSFRLRGRARVTHLDTAIEGEILRYDRAKAFFQTDKGARFFVKKIEGGAREISYNLKDEQLVLNGGVELEMKVREEPLETLTLSCGRFFYNRNSRKGEADDHVQVVRGGSRASAKHLAFEMFPGEENIKFAVLEGQVTGQMLKSKTEEAPQEDPGLVLLRSEEQSIEAGKIQVRPFKDLPRINTLEAWGNCKLLFRFASGSQTQIESKYVNFEFNSDLKLKQFRAEKKVKMVDKEAGAGSSRQVEGREMSVQGTTNILQVAGEADKVAKMSSEESLIDAQKLQIHLEKNDFGAQGSVKAIFRPAGGKKEAFGFFSKEQPVFLTAQEMRYFKEEKRFLFNENIRIWQEKEMLFGQKIILWEETGAMTGEGQMKSIFAHQLKDKKKEERIEISAEKMGYNPKENLLTFEAQSALKVKNANLTAQSILVYPQEDRSGLKQILAKGNVVIVQDLREGSGNEAVYDVSAETIVITGNPVLKEKDKGAIDGDKLTFYLADGKIAIENKERERSVTFIKS